MAHNHHNYFNNVKTRSLTSTRSLAISNRLESSLSPLCYEVTKLQFYA